MSGATAAVPVLGISPAGDEIQHCHLGLKQYSYFTIRLLLLLYYWVYVLLFNLKLLRRTTFKKQDATAMPYIPLELMKIPPNPLRL
jgi:hypothetical protein